MGENLGFVWIRTSVELYFWLIRAMYVSTCTCMHVCCIWGLYPAYASKFLSLLFLFFLRDFCFFIA